MDLNKIFSENITKDFIFPFDSYRLFLQGMSINPVHFYNKWSSKERKLIVDEYFKTNTRLDWKWALCFPFFSHLEKLVHTVESPMIIGLSGLPGSGKSTIGFWIDCVARDLNLDIKVISLDDFYLPAIEMDTAMRGNPWNVPRGFPGSHSIDLLNNSLDTYLKTGILNSPIFDKSLRNGKGDRSGWFECKPKVLILEGWFVGCEPNENSTNLDNLMDTEFDLLLSASEKEYRKLIQRSLYEYSKIWKKFDKLWHLKSSNFRNTILWKKQQESEMLKIKGSALEGDKLTDFIRMILASIPQASLSFLNSDTTIEINEFRRICNLSTEEYIF